MVHPCNCLFSFDDCLLRDWDTLQNLNRVCALKVIVLFFWFMKVVRKKKGSQSRVALKCDNPYWKSGCKRIAALAVNYCTPDGKPCTRKATKELGYFLAVNALKSIGEGRDSTLEMYCFRLFLSCITFKLFQGDILEGVVHKVLKHGVFLSCGPVKNISLKSENARLLVCDWGVPCLLEWQAVKDWKRCCDPFHCDWNEVALR